MVPRPTHVVSRTEWISEDPTYVASTASCVVRTCAACPSNVSAVSSETWRNPIVRPSRTNR